MLGTIRFSVGHRTKGNIGRPDIGGVKGKVYLILYKGPCLQPLQSGFYREIFRNKVKIVFCSTFQCLWFIYQMSKELNLWGYDHTSSPMDRDFKINAVGYGVLLLGKLNAHFNLLMPL